MPGIKSERCKQRRLGSKLCRLLFVCTNHPPNTPPPSTGTGAYLIVKRFKSFVETAFSFKSGCEIE